MGKKSTGKQARIKAVAIANTFGWIIVVVAAYAVMQFMDFKEAYSSDDKTQKCITDTISAHVTTDGSLAVDDAREYSFTGSWSLCAAKLDPPTYGKSVVRGVDVVDADGTKTALTKVPFKEVWRTSGGPGSGKYCYDEDYDTIYAFSKSKDTTKTFVFHYIYTNAIEQYSDLSVLYWQFVPSGWDVDTNNVTATVTLPVPFGKTVKPGENVYSFGHGSLNGNVSYDAKGRAVYTVPEVKKGTFAEMRVAFPKSWTSQINTNCKHDYEYMDIMQDEEQQWQAEAELARIASILALVVPIALSLVMILLSIILFMKYGKEYKPEFQDDYWRDVPDKNLHPAVVGRIWRWNKEDANDITATLMHLSAKGIVKVDAKLPDPDEKKGLFSKKDKGTYELTLLKKPAPSGLSEIDYSALNLVFDKAGDGTTVTIKDLEKYAKDHAESYVASVEKWETQVDRETDGRQFFEPTGQRICTVFRVVAGCAMILALVFSSIMENFAPVLGIVLGCAVMFGFSFVMPRRSREAVEVQARCEGLKHWFKDFTRLDEAIPTDAKVWGELLVYAYVFGVAEEVAEDLNRTVPDMMTTTEWMGYGYWYCHPSDTLAGPAASSDFFGNAFNNTIASAQSTIAAANSSSSGGSFGGGGGFSGGGGGGFGGGGGGFSR